MNVYLYPSNTETELQNAYIGEVVTDVYNLQQYTSTNTSIVGINPSIYKSGYKIISVEYTTPAKTYGTYMPGKTYIQIDDGADWWYRPLSILWGTDNYCRTEYAMGGSQINGRSISGDNHNGNNNMSVKVTRDDVTINLNGTITSYTLTGNEKTTVETSLDRSTARFTYAVKYGYIGPGTLTVTYVPNS